MERHGHDTVGRVERLFDAVTCATDEMSVVQSSRAKPASRNGHCGGSSWRTVMDVDVDVDHAWVVLEQLQNSEDDIVAIAETRSFWLLGVVQPSGPVDRDVSLVVVQLDRTPDASTAWQLAKSDATTPDIARCSVALYLKTRKVKQLQATAWAKVDMYRYSPSNTGQSSPTLKRFNCWANLGSW
jgi:hypothetical protein